MKTALRVFFFTTLLIAFGVQASSAQVGVQLPDTTAEMGDGLVLPIQIDNVDGKDITSYEFTLPFDSSVVKITGAHADSATTPSAPTVNATETELKVSFASAQALSGGGTLLHLEAEVVGKGSDSLQFKNFQLFDSSANEVTSETTSGAVTVGESGGQSVGEFLSSSTFVMRAETGADVDLSAVLNDGDLQADSLDGHAVWSRSMQNLTRSSDDLKDYRTYPSDVTFRFAVGTSGLMRVGIEAPTEEKALLALATTAYGGAGGGNKDFQGNYVPESEVVYENYHLSSDLRMNMLGDLLQRRYRDFYKDGYVISGPADNNEFISQTKFSLDNRLNRSVWVVFSEVWHQQADYSWYDEEDAPMHDSIMAQWSPATQQDADMTLGRTFDLSYTNPGASAIGLQANNDNGNSSFIKLDGTQRISKNDCCNNDTFILGETPGDVKIEGYTTWSSLGPRFKMAVLADEVTAGNMEEYENSTTNPSDSYDQNPDPFIYTIEPGWNSVKEDQPVFAPSGLTAQAGEGTVTLSWNSSSGATGYNVYRDTSSFNDVANATQVTASPVSDTSYTDTGVANGTTYHYRVAAVDSAGNESDLSGEVSAVPKSADLSDGLAAFYPFNGNANDASGNGHNATVSGAALTTDRFGNEQSAYDFDGQDDYVNLGSTSSILTGSSYSLSLWVRIDSASDGGNRQILSSETYYEDYGDVTLNSDEYRFYTGNNWYSTLSLSDSVKNGNWHHVALVHDGKSGSLFVDGNEVDSSSLDEFSVNSEELHVGASIAERYAPIDGSVDDVRLYDRPLSATEIQDLYDGRDSSSPERPPNLSASAGDQSISLRWRGGGGNTGFSGYNVYRDTSSFSDVADATQVTASPVSDTSYTDTDLTNGITYHYRVTAVDSAGNESSPSIEVSVTPRSEGDVIYAEDFSSDPGYEVLYSENTDGSAEVYWDSTANDFYAKVRDQSAEWWSLGKSPVFPAVDSSDAFTVSFQFNPVEPDWGHYPGIYFISSDSSSGPREWKTIFNFDIASSDNYDKQFRLTSENRYSTPTIPAEDEWYDVTIDYDPDTKTIDLTILRANDSTFVNETGIAMPMSGSFDQIMIGETQSNTKYGDQAQIRVDDIMIETSTADRYALGDGYEYFVTGREYDSETEDIPTLIDEEYGSEAELAEWNDLKDQLGGDKDSLVSFLDGVGMTERGDDAFVTRGGNRFYSGDRHYFMSRQNGDVPSSSLVHDQMHSKTVTLGSWYTTKPALVRLPVEQSSFATWPGDANNDGTVDQADVLPLGLYWGSTGPARTETSCSWQGWSVSAWSTEAATYADANGDGTVDQADVLCIGLNWGETRETTKGGVLANKSEAGEAGRLELRRAEQSGPTRWIEVYATDVESLMGVATELTFDSDVVSVEAVEVGARMGESALLQSKVDEANGTLGLGVSRKGTEGQKAAAGGPVARVKLRSSKEQPEIGIRSGQASTTKGATVSLSTDGGLKSLPEKVTLRGGAPNPVRQSATLRYALPEAQHVRLTVYDVLGREVAVLVNRKQEAGRKQVRVDASEWSAGTYFYRLETENATKSDRLTVVR